MFRIESGFRKSLRGLLFRLLVNRWTIPFWDWIGGDVPTGAAGERIAERYLRANGWITIERNFLASHGEIDIVMVDGDTLVFVEVKTASQARSGESPADAVDAGKEKSISSAATEFLSVHDLMHQKCRFDVVAVVMGNGQPVVRHYRSAFEPPMTFDW